MAAHSDAHPLRSVAHTGKIPGPPPASANAKRWLRVLTVLTNDPDAAYLLDPAALAAAFLVVATSHDLRPARHGIALVLRWRVVAAQTPVDWAFHWAEHAAELRTLREADERMDERTVLATEACAHKAERRMRRLLRLD